MRTGQMAPHLDDDDLVFTFMVRRVPTARRMSRNICVRVQHVRRCGPISLRR